MARNKELSQLPAEPMFPSGGMADQDAVVQEIQLPVPPVGGSNDGGNPSIADASAMIGKGPVVKQGPGPMKADPYPGMPGC
jgi:hypothetical protein